MKFSITGLNHKSAPVEVRERLAFDTNAVSEALGELKRQAGFMEGLILSTCNRVEIAIACGDDPQCQVEAGQFLADFRHVERQWVAPYLYHYDDREGPFARWQPQIAELLWSLAVGDSLVGRSGGQRGNIVREVSNLLPEEIDLLV